MCHAPLKFSISKICDTCKKVLLLLTRGQFATATRLKPDSINQAGGAGTMAYSDAPSTLPIPISIIFESACIL